MAPLLRIALLIFAGANLVRAQDAGLTLSVRSPSVRQDSPIPIELTFNSRAPGIVEGVIEFRTPETNQRRQVHRSGEIAIRPGRSTQRMLLPPFHMTGQSLELQILFHGKKGTRDFGLLPLAVWNSETPPLRVAVCLDGVRWPSGSIEMWHSLQLHRRTTGGRGEAPPPVHSWLDPEDAPAHVLGWCAYDLVIVGGPGFRALREKQLASLVRWVRAGGSVLIIAESQANESQLTFLNELAADYPGRFSADGSGDLQSPSGWPGEFHADFGRAVVLPPFSDEPGQWEAARWRRSVAFLWKMRRDLIPRMMSEGSLTHSDTDSEASGAKGRAESEAISTDLQRILKASLPEHITPVPFFVVALVFLWFVLLIGPMDRLVLRKLRITRWTWVVFPLICGGFTWLMVSLANAHLGRNDQTGTLCIRDVGADGSVLRETRIETLFAGSTREHVSRIASATILDVPDAAEGRANSYRHNSSIPTATTAGSLLAGYEFRQTLQQWAPRMTVTRSFEPTRDDSGIDWSAMPKQRPLAAEWPEIRRKLDPGSKFLLWLRSEKPVVDLSTPKFETLCRGVAPSDFREFLAQSSPRPGAPLDDLALIEPGDPDAWLIIAMQQNGPRDVMVWRRVFRWPRE